MKNKALKLHEKYRGKIEMKCKVPLNTLNDLSIYYSPGVAEPSKKIHKDVSKTNVYTNRGNTIAVISDGSAVLGLGNIGPEASLPVMEGKAALFKEFGNVDAVPIILNTQKTEEIIQIIKGISPTFGGINLEDISAPRCIEIERRLKKELNIPVFHDDQHGTAIVITAALLNASRLTKKVLQKLNVLIIGTGAAGSSIAKMIKKMGINRIYAYNKDGFVNDNSSTDIVTSELLKHGIIDSFHPKKNKLIEGFYDTDIVIGVSAAGIIKEKMIKAMNKDPWVFAIANPIPEIMPEKAKNAGAFIVGSGRSDYPNQINNLLAFPGLFRGILDANIINISNDIKFLVAKTIANSISDDLLSVDYIIPSNMDKNIPKLIAQAIVNFKK